jgi:hypothetical protein
MYLIEVGLVFVLRSYKMFALEKLERVKALANSFSEELSRPRKLVIFASDATVVCRSYSKGF